MILKKGSKDPKVTALQKILNVRLELFGKEKLKTDGDFGDKTNNALIMLYRRDTVDDSFFNKMMLDVANIVKMDELARSEGKPHPLKVAQGIIDNDQRIFQFYLKAQETLRLAKLAGKTEGIPAIEQQLMKMLAGYAVRQKRLQQAGASDNIYVYTSYPAAYKDLVKKYSGVSGIGVIPILIAVGAILFVGAVGASIYAWMLPDYEASAKSVDVIPQLEKALLTLSPEERKAVMDNLQKQKDDAFYAGKMKQQKDSGGFFGNAKSMIILFGLGVILAPKVLGAGGRK